MADLGINVNESIGMKDSFGKQSPKQEEIRDVAKIIRLTKEEDRDKVMSDAIGLYKLTKRPVVIVVRIEGG